MISCLVPTSTTHKAGKSHDPLHSTVRPTGLDGSKMAVKSLCLAMQLYEVATFQMWGLTAAAESPSFLAPPWQVYTDS